MIFIASKGHLLTHIPQPMQRVSEMKQMVEVGLTSMHIFPVLAFLFALFWLALVGIDNSDSEFVVSYAAFHI